MQKIKNLIVLTIIVLIPFGIMLWYRGHEAGAFASIELILYPILFGGGSIVLLYLLKKFFLRESFSEFNNGKGNLLGDIGFSILLTAIYFVLFYVERMTLMGPLVISHALYDGIQVAMLLITYPQ